MSEKFDSVEKGQILPEELDSSKQAAEGTVATLGYAVDSAPTPTPVAKKPTLLKRVFSTFVPLKVHSTSLKSKKYWYCAF